MAQLGSGLTLGHEQPPLPNIKLLFLGMLSKQRNKYF